MFSPLDVFTYEWPYDIPSSVTYWNSNKSVRYFLCDNYDLSVLQPFPNLPCVFSLYLLDFFVILSVYSTVSYRFPYCDFLIFLKKLKSM